MTGELKPPKTIYLQWDADPLAENTWSEDRINDDDIKYTRSDMEWIPVGEPPTNYRDETGEFIPFLVCENDGDYPFRAIYDGVNWGDGIFKADITYWMPLPEAPKEEE